MGQRAWWCAYTQSVKWNKLNQQNYTITIKTMTPQTCNDTVHHKRLASCCCGAAGVMSSDPEWTEAAAAETVVRRVVGRGWTEAELVATAEGPEDTLFRKSKVQEEKEYNRRKNNLHHNITCWWKCNWFCNQRDTSDCSFWRHLKNMLFPAIVWCYSIQQQPRASLPFHS